MSGLLQGPTQDIHVISAVNIIIQELKLIRKGSAHLFNEVWDEAEIMAKKVSNMAKKVSTAIAVPRMCNRQTTRNNVTADSPK